MGAPKKPNTKKVQDSDNDEDDDQEPTKAKKKYDDDDDDFDGPLDDDLGRGGFDSFEDEDEDDY